jgi:putative chitobiose transport system substrate-binding protein
MRFIHHSSQKSRLTTQVVVVALALVLAGFSSASGAQKNVLAKKDVTVQWWTNNLQKGFSGYIEGLIHSYEAQHPNVTINWVDVPPTDMTQKLLAAIASGSVPDAVNLSSAELGSFEPALSNLHHLFSSKDLAVYQRGLVKSLDKNGTQYGIPWYNGGGLISYYRKSVMDKVGFTAAKAPKTFDQTLQLAQKVHDKTGVYGMDLSFIFTLPYYYDIPMLNANKTKAAFNTPKMAAVLKELKTAYDKGALAPGTIGPDWHNYAETVANKRIAFMPANWATDIGGIQKNAPEVYADLAVAPGPTTPHGKSLLNGQQTFVIPAKSKNQIAAADWLKFVTNAANQLAFCRLVAIYPSSVATLKDPFFSNPPGNTVTDAARQLVIASISKIVDVGSYGTSHDIELQKLFSDDVRAALTGSESVKQALDTAEKDWNSLLASS